MAKCKGFLVDGIPMCCDCALYYAEKSGYPHLFFQINKMVDMDSDIKCCCNKYPCRKKATEAAAKIAKLFEGYK